MLTLPSILLENWLIHHQKDIQIPDDSVAYLFVSEKQQSSDVMMENLIFLSL